MTFEIKVPEVGESIQEVQIGRWLKEEGDEVAEDEDVVELETDKASMELPAPRAGVLREIRRREGETAAVGDVIAVIDESNGQPEPKAKSKTGKQEEACR
jgi:2-oxoglutarate dehydrogenase E2 component (dihydrolipoamide succinyltransferase)